jgi:poly(3-hydroxybutyrate) depolymerase
VKINTVSIIMGLTGIALGGCHLYNNDNNNTACAGYIGCSAGKVQIGIAPPSDASAGEVVARAQINLGCGKPLPANQVQTAPGTPKGYTSYKVIGTGANLTNNPVPTKAGPRTFWVRVPVDYDPNHKYRVVYVGQGCGGYEVANTATLQLYKEASGGTEEAIYVALDIPRDMANQDCYDNRDGPSSQEWEAFELFHTVVDSTYCVDNDRVYVSGYSTGGWLTDMWGCYFAGDGQNPWNGTPKATPSVRSSDLGASGPQVSRAGNASDAAATDGLVSDAGSGDTMSTVSEAGAADVMSGDDGSTGGAADTAPFVPTPGARKFAPQYHIRAQAGVSGGEPDNNPPCNGPIAAIWIHDLMDSNAYSGNHDLALPRVLKMNGCYKATPPTVPWHEDIMGTGVCVQYTDCPAAFPVVFCTTVGLGHADQHERAIPGFKAFFQEMEAKMTPVPTAP